MSDRESPCFTQVNGPLMARRLDHVEGRPAAFQAGHIPSCRVTWERPWVLPAAGDGSYPSSGPLHDGCLPSPGNCPVTARTLQGMARVRPGRLLPDPYFLVRSVRRGSRVKHDFACTFTRLLSPVLVALRSQSRLRLEGRTRTLSGPSPDLSPAWALALPPCPTKAGDAALWVRGLGGKSWPERRLTNT